MHISPDQEKHLLAALRDAVTANPCVLERDAYGVPKQLLIPHLSGGSVAITRDRSSAVKVVTSGGEILLHADGFWEALVNQDAVRGLATKDVERVNAVLSDISEHARQGMLLGLSDTFITRRFTARGSCAFTAALEFEQRPLGIIEYTLRCERTVGPEIFGVVPFSYCCTADIVASNKAKTVQLFINDGVSASLFKGLSGALAMRSISVRHESALATIDANGIVALMQSEDCVRSINARYAFQLIDGSLVILCATPTSSVVDRVVYFQEATLTVYRVHSIESVNGDRRQRESRKYQNGPSLASDTRDPHLLVMSDIGEFDICLADLSQSHFGLEQMQSIALHDQR